MKRRLAVTWSAILILTLGTSTAAQAADREFGAHEHGVGRLNVAIEGRTVEMELMSPGADIVGFEHEAETAADKAAVERAVSVLQRGENLFVFPSEADCGLAESEVETETDDHEDDKEHEHAEKETDDGEHGEFHARYRFECGNPNDLTHVDVKLFEAFPTARELDVQAISPRGQIAQELTPAAARLNF